MFCFVGVIVISIHRDKGPSLQGKSYGRLQFCSVLLLLTLVIGQIAVYVAIMPDLKLFFDEPSDYFVA